MAQAHLVRLDHLLQAQDLFDVACHRLQRRTMWHQARTTLSRPSSLLSQFKRSSRHLLPTRRSSLSNLLSPHAFPTLTMARTLVPAVSHRPLLHRLLDWQALQDSLLRDLSHLLVVQVVLHQRCVPLLRTVLGLRAMVTRDRTSTMLIPLRRVASLVVHLRQLLLLLQLKQLRETVRIDRPLRPQKGTGSGRRAPSCSPTTRSARNLKNLTAAVLRHLTACRPHRFHAKAHRPRLTLAASTMATIHQRLLTTRLLWPRSAHHRHRRHRCRACRRPLRPQRRLVPSTMSQPLVT
jgi:hypothetical protein